MQEYLDRRYAKALFEVAGADNKINDYISDLKQVAELIKTNNDLHYVIHDPKISTSRKKELFIDIFQSQIDKKLLSFLLILIQKNRIAELSEIIFQVEEILLEKNNEIVAIVKTVVSLKDDERTRLVDKLQAKYNKSIILKESIDESIIGGVYVRIGDDVIDGTIKNKIEEMKKLMLVSR